VHVGISMLAVEWLSQPIAHPPADHIGVMAGDALALAEGRAQAEADWRLFLAERGREIVPGGRLLVSVPGRNETDWCARGPYDLLNRACRELVGEGRIDASRYAAFCFPVYARAADELALPAVESGLFTIERCETLDLPIGFECAFNADGDTGAYAAALVGAWKAVSEPVLRAALLRPGDDPAPIDAVYQRALQAGATSLMEPADQFYGDRSAGVKDVVGNQWWIATHREDVPPDEMLKRAKAAGVQPR
jgi:hypothetical protein